MFGGSSTWHDEVISKSKSIISTCSFMDHTSTSESFSAVNDKIYVNVKYAYKVRKCNHAL